MQLTASEEDFANTMVTFFQQKKNLPHLNKLLDFDSMDIVTDAATFYRLVSTVIAKANLTNKPSV